MKSARSSGELEIDALKEEIDQLRTWKDKVVRRSVYVPFCDYAAFNRLVA